MTFGTNLTDQERNAALFDSLFEQHRNVVFSFLLGRCGDRELAKDLLQETYLRVWRKIDDVAKMPADQRRYWLIAIAKNVQIDDSRRRASRPIAQAEATGANFADLSQTPDILAEKKSALAQIDRAIRDLPEDLRTVLVLSAMEGLNSSEIGTMLDIPAGTARYLLSEARRQLAAKVGKL